MNTLLLPPVLGVVGMLAAALVYMLVMKYPDGEDKVKKIGDQIHAGRAHRRCRHRLGRRWEIHRRSMPCGGVVRRRWNGPLGDGGRVRCPERSGAGI